MKRIAKNRPRRLVAALASLASTIRRTLAGGTLSPAGHREARTGMGHSTRSIRASNVGARLALIPAHPQHFDWIAQTLREGAASGSFEAEIGTDSMASRLFFENLRQALQTGYFLEQRGSGAPAQVAASGYVLVLTKTTDTATPLGFAFFKSMGGVGFELWLAAVDRRYRGRGFCKAMLQAALGTPAGMLAHVARVNRAAADSEAMGRALAAAGYRHERDGPDVRWFVRQDAPQALLRLVRAGDVRLAEA
jgi:ribosomal protein S18 acetylase RimI-like enzyme